jgi:HEAT repeat protein
MIYSGCILITSGQKITAKGYAQMLAENLYQVEQLNTFTTLPLVIEIQSDPQLEKLLADLSPDTSWGDRQIAARKIGYMRSPKALPALLAVLPLDPFWMVRCAIIQSLESIGDPAAIPTLREVAESDGFQVVRSYAAKAVERLSQEG